MIHAAKNGHFELVRLLIEYRADPNKRDVRGKSALDYAVEINHQDMVRYLLVHFANPDKRCIDNTDNEETRKILLSAQKAIQRAMHGPFKSRPERWRFHMLIQLGTDVVRALEEKKKSEEEES